MEDIWLGDSNHKNMVTAFKIENTRVKYSTDNLLLDNFSVQSVPFNYTISFVSEKQLETELRKINVTNKQKHFVYIDNTVAALYGNSIFNNLELFPLSVKETNKTLPVVTKLLDRLQEKNFTKKEIFLSAGGGITQDVSSFARAVFKRGIHWTYVPTTLLAMGDSCIGAKACLNYDEVKNLLGLFSAPREVLIHAGFLKTLTGREILSGYGEIIKLSIIGGTASIEKFAEIKKNQNGNLLKNVEQMIKLSLLVKKAVIELDEYENNIRKALNYGHTIGHAIEPLVNYKIPHGIAISIGMMIENLVAVEWGSLSQKVAHYLNNLIFPFVDKESLVFLKKIPSSDVIKNMMRDKKTLNNDIYMSVPKSIGHFDMLRVRSDNYFEKYLQTIMTQIASR